jgi:hypothetical protein
MAVSAADRARQSERISQTREEAEEREAKLLKRKNEQLKRAEQRHQQEISRLNEAYKNQLGEVREEQRNTLNEREKDHQEDISSLRKNYTGTLQKKMESSETDKKAIRETYQGEIDKQKVVSKSQRQNLIEKQKRELAKRDEDVANTTLHARGKMKEAIEDSSRRLREAHDKEINVFKTRNDDNRLQTELDKNQMRKAYESQKNATARQANFQEAEWKQKYQDLAKQVSTEQVEGFATQGNMLSQGLKDVKNKYDRKLAEKSDQMDESNDVFRESVSERVNTQVRSRDSKIQELAGKLNNQIVNDKRIRSMERNNLQTSYEDKMKNLVDQKDQIKETMQDLNKKRITEMKSRNDNVLRKANQDYRSQMEIERSRFRENILTTEQMRENEINRINDHSESRINKIQEMSQLNTQRMGNFYEDNIQQAKEGFDRKVVDQRERNIELQGQLNRNMSERFRKIENNYAQKLEKTVNNYEVKLQELKDQHEREIRRLQANSKSMLEDKEKGHRTDHDSVEMKYEAKIALMEQAQQDRMEKMQKRHQEELRDLALKMNQYNRKA